MTDINRAKELFQRGEYTCVLCKGDITHTSTAIGISPMIDFITADTNLKGFSAADKIVGKAAAQLFVSAGIIEVYADVMSAQAVDVFEKYDVKFSHKTLTEAIINRAGNGLCPMEQCVHNIDNPSEAIDAIRNMLNFLKAKNREAVQ
jgi:hypothetical protein